MGRSGRTCIHKFIMPFVILGVVLSTLHQSSLGSLLLIQPTKLHPLWWTPILPIMFFVSAVAIGLAMIILESSLSSRYFKRGLETHLLEKLAAGIPIVLGIYLVLKFGELLLAGELGLLFTSGMMSVLFWAEILIGSSFPLIWFSSRTNRQIANGAADRRDHPAARHDPQPLQRQLVRGQAPRPADLPADLHEQRELLPNPA